MHRPIEWGGPCARHGRDRSSISPLIKCDGYPLRVERDGDRVRLITKGGYNWTDCYPWIMEAARKNRHRHFVIDGEAVVLGVDGISDFDALHSGKHGAEVQLCAFDVLAMDGDDLCGLPLSMRKVNLDRLLRGRPDGIFINPFEVGAIGPELFRAACRMGLEGIVSKRRDRPYQSGRSKHWIKIKNPAHPAMSRVMDALSKHRSSSEHCRLAHHAVRGCGPPLRFASHMLPNSGKQDRAGKQFFVTY